MGNAVEASSSGEGQPASRVGGKDFRPRQGRRRRKSSLLLSQLSLSLTRTLRLADGRSTGYAGVVWKHRGRGGGIKLTVFVSGRTRARAFAPDGSGGGRPAPHAGRKRHPTFAQSLFPCDPEKQWGGSDARR